METKTLKSWEEFEDELVKINAATIALHEKTQRHVDYPLFRGHSNSERHLESTLGSVERGMSVSDYDIIIKRIHIAVYPSFATTWYVDTGPLIFGFTVSALEFLVYL